jgi:hypothetical protein
MSDFVSFCVDVQLWVKNLNCWLTQSMQHSPSWEANSFSASPKFPHIVWNLKILHRVHHSSTLVHVPRHMNPAHNFPFYSVKVHFNMSSLGRLGFPKSLILSGCLTKTENASCCFPACATCRSHPILLHPGEPRNRPRRTHRVSGGICQLFLNLGTRRGCVVSITPRPPLPPGKPPCPLYRRLGGPRSRSG